MKQEEREDWNKVRDDFKKKLDEDRKYREMMDRQEARQKVDILSDNSQTWWQRTKSNIEDKWDYVKGEVNSVYKTGVKHMGQNLDQLDVKTDTYHAVKEVYQEYKNKGINVDSFDIDRYINDYGEDKFYAKMQNSEMVDANRYPNGVYWSEKDVNISYANEANKITIADDRETGTVFIKVPVTMEDENGREFVVNMYTRDDTFEGMQGNIVAGAAARIAAYAYDPYNPVPISMSHTHPANGNNEGNFSLGFGDELVARFPRVNNMYLNDVDQGNKYLFDESKPSSLFAFNKTPYQEIDYEIEIP